MSGDPGAVWTAFLRDVDDVAATSACTVDLHCLGGFVMSAAYGMPRPTGDLDVFEVVPATALRLLIEKAGRGTPLARRHGLFLDANSRLATVPERYIERLTELFPARFAHLRVLAFDPYDLALSKLERNVDRDRSDVLWLAQSRELDVAVLRDRYVTEVRPLITGLVARHDLTLDLWIDMIEEVRARRDV